MDTEKVLEVVTSALDLEPSARRAFLDRACSGNADLRAEVESLLGQQERVRDFIETPPAMVAAQALETVDADPFEGKRIGHYRLVRKIGRGGMGAVYLAERDDEQYRKQVAIKLITYGFDLDEVHRRFRHERQILATLDHPNIAKLLDGGTTDEGLPYFVMDLVDGVPIDAYCDARKLNTNARLALFRTVCSAVHYAHQNLIIHRDIKPGNILVTADGVPKLLDFGIAKLLDPDPTLTLARTITEMKALTPEYASPEQVKGEKVTTASDIYSLGVVLYRLLTGQRPYRLKTQRPDELARAICENEPTKPSAAIARGEGSSKSEIPNPKLLRGDLDNIVLMAMRKEPARRYASVAQFAEDIRRHLEGLPVRARKDTWSYRSSKFVRRHKVGVAAMAVIVLAIAAGLIGTIRQKNRAERRFSDVRQLANALLFEIAPKIERLEGATEARQSLLTQSLKYLDSLAHESAGDQALQSELAAAYEKIGDLQGNPTNPNLMVLTDALASYRKANSMRRKLLERNPKDTEQRRLLANNYRVLGDLHWQTNEPTKSQENSEAALRLYTELLAEQPESNELRLAIAGTNDDIGQLFSSNEKHADAIPYFAKAIAVSKKLRQQFPDRMDVLTSLAAAHEGMGNALSWADRQKEGEEEMAKAIEIYEPLVAANPNDSELRSELYRAYVLTSSVYENINDTVATEYAFKALKVAETAVEKDPANLRAKHYLATAYSRVGVTLPNIGKAAESIPYLEKAGAIFEALAAKETMNRRYKQQLGLVFLRLGDARYKARDFDGALRDLERAAAIYAELIASDASDNASLKNLASVNKSLAETHEQIATLLNDERKQSHRDSARKYFLLARDIFRKLEAQKTLSEFDRKALQETEIAANKYK